MIDFVLARWFLWELTIVCLVSDEVLSPLIRGTLSIILHVFFYVKIKNKINIPRGGKV